MTRKEFLNKIIFFVTGILFVRETKLFVKIFDASKNDLKEARFYKILK